jgi:hypothetical protein
MKSWVTYKGVFLWVGILKLIWEILPELNWENLSELFPEVPSC